MTAENQDITVHQGEDFERTFAVKEDGSTKDVSGGTFSWGAARTPGDTPAVSDSDSGVTVEEGNAAGQVVLTVDKTVTETLSGDYFHELDVTLNNTTATVATGVLSVLVDTR